MADVAPACRKVQAGAAEAGGRGFGREEGGRRGMQEKARDERGYVDRADAGGGGRRRGRGRLGVCLVNPGPPKPSILARLPH